MKSQNKTFEFSMLHYKLKYRRRIKLKKHRGFVKAIYYIRPKTLNPNHAYYEVSLLKDLDFRILLL